MQATNSRHAVQRPADFRLLRGTVHIRNAEALDILRAEGFWLETRFADRFQGLGQRVVIGGNGKLSIPQVESQAANPRHAFQRPADFRLL